MKFRKLIFFSLLFFPILAKASNPEEKKIIWQHNFDQGTFALANKEKKLIILDLEAIWCHWCHVMEEQTYSNSSIIEIINKNYIPLRIDQDSRPDLGNMYQDYGWPATIIFNEQGEELEKLTGFVEPLQMQQILTELVKDPTPRKNERKLEFSISSNLSAELKEELLSRYQHSADKEKGGLKTGHRYLDADTLEYAIKLAINNNQESADFAKLTLKENEKIIDPVWGGVYQYSTGGVWTNPHFEKISVKQSENLKIYALAYAFWKEPAYKKAIDQIYSYMQNFLKDPAGPFYTSQDADLIKGVHSDEYFKLSDEARRKQGIPAIDRHIYSNENGRMISALSTLYAVTSDEKYLAEAILVAEWIIKNRSLENGGYRHGENDTSGPYLTDTLYLGQAFLNIYAVSADRKWLALAEAAVAYIKNNFSSNEDGAGYLTAKSEVIKAKPLVSENIVLVRFLSSLFYYSGKEEYKELVKPAMRFLATREIATENITEAGILLADEELNLLPTHLVVVGAKSDPIAKTLFQEALKFSAPHKRTEWWDRAEGPMPNPDVQYPPLPKAAAFVCTNKRCSLPIFKVEDLVPTIKKLSGKS